MASDKSGHLRLVTQRAFRQEATSPLRRSGRSAVMTRPIANAVLARLIGDYRSGALQSHLPALNGRLRPDAAIESIKAWTPDHANDIAGRYLLGFSLSYEYYGGRGEVYSIRIRAFSDATLRCGSKDPGYNHLVVAIGNRIAKYACEPEIAELFPESNAQEPFEGKDFADSFQVTAHPMVRHAVEQNPGKGIDEVLRVGDSIRHADCSDGLGTLSLFVRWQGADCALGAAHVVARENAKIGTDILWARASSDPNRPIGRYVHPPAIAFEDRQGAPLDAALFEISPALRVEGNVFRRPGKGERVYRVTDICSIVPSQQNRRPPVKIVARGQRIVDAEISAISAFVPTVGPNDELYTYNNMLEIRLPAGRNELPKQKSVLTLGGDSGAGLYVVGEDGSAGYAGMVVCGNGKSGDGGLAYALGSDAIFQGLHLTLRNEGS